MNHSKLIDTHLKLSTSGWLDAVLPADVNQTHSLGDTMSSNNGYTHLSPVHYLALRRFLTLFGMPVRTEHSDEIDPEFQQILSNFFSGVLGLTIGYPFKLSELPGVFLAAFDQDPGISQIPASAVSQEVLDRVGELALAAYLAAASDDYGFEGYPEQTELLSIEGVSEIVSEDLPVSEGADTLNQTDPDAPDVGADEDGLEPEPDGEGDENDSDATDDAADNEGSGSQVEEPVEEGEGETASADEEEQEDEVEEAPVKPTLKSRRKLRV